MLTAEDKIVVCACVCVCVCVCVCACVLISIKLCVMSFFEKKAIFHQNYSKTVKILTDSHFTVATTCTLLVRKGRTVAKFKDLWGNFFPYEKPFPPRMDQAKVWEQGRDKTQEDYLQYKKTVEKDDKKGTLHLLHYTFHCTKCISHIPSQQMPGSQSPCRSLPPLNWV